MKATFNPKEGWSYYDATKTFHVSEKHLRFATEYELIVPGAGQFIFKFSHSTGPEFDPKTSWIYKSEDGTTLEVHNDEKITARLAKNYLEGKTKRQEELRYVAISHIGNSPDPTWRDEAGKPVTYPTKRAAEIKMIEDFVDTIQRQLEEVKIKARDVEEVDIDMEEEVVKVLVKEDGRMVLENGTILYDPKTAKP